VDVYAEAEREEWWEQRKCGGCEFGCGEVSIAAHVAADVRRL
jgi:hypothetical protein